VQHVRVVNRAATLAAIVLGTTITAKATWSIIVVHTATREIVVGSATCLVATNSQQSAAKVV